MGFRSHETINDHFLDAPRRDYGFSGSGCFSGLIHSIQKSDFEWISFFFIGVRKMPSCNYLGWKLFAPKKLGRRALGPNTRGWDPSQRQHPRVHPEPKSVNWGRAGVLSWNQSYPQHFEERSAFLDFTKTSTWKSQISSLWHIIDWHHLKTS